MAGSPRRETIIEVRVFLVEDLATTRSLIEELMSALGGLRLVGTATNEGEAKLWIDEHPREWDLAVVDLVLEAGAGMGVIRHARNAHPAAMIVVFSSYVSPGIRTHCTRLGADAVFDKSQSREFVGWLRAQAQAASP